jgi:16S rRNA (guanine966-N2)-methyltransferase
MRISGGQDRGRPLKAPKHGGLRPTSDKVREALFSILGAKVDGASFLELFAGTGAVGMEALSRGAARAVFVDLSPKATRLIKENLKSLGYRDRAAVVTKDALQFLRNTAASLGPYDIVFVDPPYHEGMGEKTMVALGEGGAGGAEGEPDYLSPGAVVVYERFKKSAAPESFGRLVKKKDYVYGDTALSVYVWGGP